jgi:hypothetical protein
MWIQPSEDDSPVLPANVQHVYDGAENVFYVTIYADFEVCPLEPLKGGAMQAACIASASRLFIDQYADKK